MNATGGHHVVQSQHIPFKKEMPTCIGFCCKFRFIKLCFKFQLNKAFIIYYCNSKKRQKAGVVPKQVRSPIALKCSDSYKESCHRN